MKQIFATFLALCVLPCFQTYAWVGGPFSNNSYFSESGDDGIYEAVAIPSTAGVNGIGIMRWAVTNSRGASTDNLTSIATSNTSTSGAATITTSTTNIVPITSNVFLGGVNQVSHAWFLQGLSYTGTCSGLVNSGLGVVTCNGIAQSGQDFTAGGVIVRAPSISAGFSAAFDNSGNGLPIRRFTGVGAGTTSTPVTSFTFNAFGSRVSTQVFYGGVRL